MNLYNYFKWNQFERLKRVLQKKLRLQDWDILLFKVNKGELISSQQFRDFRNRETAGVNYYCAGEVSHLRNDDTGFKLALIRLAFWKKSTLLHEMLHIKFPHLEEKEIKKRERRLAKAWKIK